MIDDGSPLSLDGIRAAAATGRLADLARRLVAERRWSSLEVLISTAGGPELEVEEAAVAVVALCEALADLPPVDQREAFAELHEPELRTARALARRSEHDPLTEVDRTGLGAAAALFLVAGENKRAAELYERAGDDESAAEIWGSLGELERMEACLGRKEAEEADRRRTREARRDFESLFAAGERQAAIEGALAAEAAGASPDARTLALAARRSLERLCRGRSVAFRLGDGQVVRLAGAPAVLGRDPEVEIALRDPSVSRRHARILATGDGLAVEDAGSRGGTVLAGFPLAGAVPLKDRGELALGASCRLGFEVRPAVVLLRADGGLDRGLFAIVGHGPIKLDDIPGLPPGLVLDFGTGVARLVRTPELQVRVAGQIIGRGCDLLHGDVIEAPGGVRWEVL